MLVTIDRSIFVENNKIGMEIRVADKRQILEMEIKRQSTREVKLEIVVDVAEWAIDNNIKVLGNPIGTSIPSQGDWLGVVVVKSKLVEDEISGVLGRLDSSGYWTETTEMRKNPSLFLRHLELHELAHLENSWYQLKEDDCDTWAFEKLYS